jgi:hypothetical protein
VSFRGKIRGADKPLTPPPMPHAGVRSPATASGAEPVEPPRVLDRALWAWPVLLIGLMAVGGQLFGTVGILVAGLGTTGAVLLATGIGVFDRRVNIAVGAVLSLMLVAVIFLNNVGLFSGRVASPSAEQLRSGANQGMVLTGIALNGMDLTGARLNGVAAPGMKLGDTIFAEAHLAGADFRGADLAGGHLHRADLRGANLSGANLRGADLTGACMEGVNLSGAVLDQVKVDGADVTGAVVGPDVAAHVVGWPQLGQNVSACS